jgi:hypothetical protein
MLPEFLLPLDEPPDRETALLGLMARMGEVFGRPLRAGTIDALGAGGADFFAVDARGEVYAVRWIEPEGLAAGLFDLVADWQRLEDAGREELARRLGVESGEAAGPIRWVLVGAAFGEGAMRAARALAFPVHFIRVRRVRASAGGRPAYFFELIEAGRESARVVKDRPARASDRSGAPVLPAVEGAA